MRDPLAAAAQAGDAAGTPTARCGRARGGRRTPPAAAPASPRSRRGSARAARGARAGDSGNATAPSARDRPTSRAREISIAARMPALQPRPHWPTRRQSSAVFSATISAAAEGVGARRSATRSAIVRSVSCPTAEIVGIRDRASARATHSLLNGFEVLGRASPAREDQDVEGAAAVEGVDRVGDLERGAVSLDPHRIDRDAHGVGPPRHHVEHVPDGRARRRGDERDARRKQGDPPLARRVEEPLRRELRLQLLEGELEGPCPDRLQVHDPQLERPLGRPEVERAPRDDLEPLLGPERERARAPRRT